MNREKEKTKRISFALTKGTCNHVFKLNAFLVFIWTNMPNPDDVRPLIEIDRSPSRKKVKPT